MHKLLVKYRAVLARLDPVVTPDADLFISLRTPSRGAMSTNPVPVGSKELRKIVHLADERLLESREHDALAEKVLRHAQSAQAPRLLAALALVPGASERIREGIERLLHCYVVRTRVVSQVVGHKAHCWSCIPQMRLAGNRGIRGGLTGGSVSTESYLPPRWDLEKTEDNEEPYLH